MPRPVTVEELKWVAEQLRARAAEGATQEALEAELEDELNKPQGHPFFTPEQKQRMIERVKKGLEEGK